MTFEFSRQKLVIGILFILSLLSEYSLFYPSMDKRARIWGTLTSLLTFPSHRSFFQEAFRISNGWLSIFFPELKISWHPIFRFPDIFTKKRERSNTDVPCTMLFRRKICIHADCYQVCCRTCHRGYRYYGVNALLSCRILTKMSLFYQSLGNYRIGRSATLSSHVLDIIHPLKWCKVKCW